MVEALQCYCISLIIARKRKRHMPVRYHTALTLKLSPHNSSHFLLHANCSKVLDSTPFRVSDEEMRNRKIYFHCSRKKWLKRFSHLAGLDLFCRSWLFTEFVLRLSLSFDIVAIHLRFDTSFDEFEQITFGTNLNIVDFLHKQLVKMQLSISYFFVNLFVYFILF